MASSGVSSRSLGGQAAVKKTTSSAGKTVTGLSDLPSMQIEGDDGGLLGGAGAERGALGSAPGDMESGNGNKMMGDYMITAVRVAALVPPEDRDFRTINAIFNFIKDVKYMQKLQRAQVRALAGVMELRRCPAKAVLCETGDEGFEYYVVLSGGLQVQKPKPGEPCPQGLHDPYDSMCKCPGRVQELLGLFGPGDGLGEAALQHGIAGYDTTRKATVLCSNDSELLVLTAANFQLHAGALYARYMEECMRFLYRCPVVASIYEISAAAPGSAFGQITEKDLANFANVLQERKYTHSDERKSKTTLIFEQGERAEKVIFLRRGRAEFIRKVFVDEAGNLLPGFGDHDPDSPGGKKSGGSRMTVARRGMKSRSRVSTQVAASLRASTAPKGLARFSMRSSTSDDLARAEADDDVDEAAVKAEEEDSLRARSPKATSKSSMAKRSGQRSGRSGWSGRSARRIRTPASPKSEKSPTNASIKGSSARSGSNRSNMSSRSNRSNTSSRSNRSNMSSRSNRSNTSSSRKGREKAEKANVSSRGPRASPKPSPGGRETHADANLGSMSQRRKLRARGKQKTKPDLQLPVLRPQLYPQPPAAAKPQPKQAEKRLSARPTAVVEEEKKSSPAVDEIVPQKSQERISASKSEELHPTKTEEQVAVSRSVETKDDASKAEVDSARRTVAVDSTLERAESLKSDSALRKTNSGGALRKTNSAGLTMSETSKTQDDLQSAGSIRAIVSNAEEISPQISSTEKPPPHPVKTPDKRHEKHTKKRSPKSKVPKSKGDKDHKSKKSADDKGESKAQRDQNSARSAGESTGDASSRGSSFASQGSKVRTSINSDATTSPITPLASGKSEAFIPLSSAEERKTKGGAGEFSVLGSTQQHENKGENTTSPPSKRASGSLALTVSLTPRSRASKRGSMPSNSDTSPPSSSPKPRKSAHFSSEDADLTEFADSQVLRARSRARPSVSAAAPIKSSLRGNPNRSSVVDPMKVEKQPSVAASVKKKHIRELALEQLRTEDDGLVDGTPGIHSHANKRGSALTSDTTTSSVRLTVGVTLDTGETLDTKATGVTLDVRGETIGSLPDVEDAAEESHMTPRGEPINTLVKQMVERQETGDAQGDVGNDGKKPQKGKPTPVLIRVGTMGPYEFYGMKEVMDKSFWPVSLVGTQVKSFFGSVSLSFCITPWFRVAVRAPKISMMMWVSSVRFRRPTLRASNDLH